MTHKDQYRDPLQYRHPSPADLVPETVLCRAAWYRFSNRNKRNRVTCPSAEDVAAPRCAAGYAAVSEGTNVRWQRRADADWSAVKIRVN